MLLLVFTHISDHRLVCRVSHTYCSVEPCPLCCAIKAAKRDLHQQGLSRSLFCNFWHFLFFEHMLIGLKKVYLITFLITVYTQATSLHFSKFYEQNRTRTYYSNRLCYNFSPQTVHPSGLFAAYDTHLVYTNRLCSFGWLQMPHITHILLRWTISVLLPNRKQFVWVNRML